MDEKVMILLNEIALLEFKTNYSLSEFQRIVDVNNFGGNKELKFYKEKLTELLPKQDNIQYIISDTGSLSINEKINENQYKTLQFIIPTLKLPYNYRMGQKIGKKAAQEVIKDLETSFSRYKD